MKHGRTGITDAEYESLKTGILETVLVGDDIYKNTDPRGTFLNHQKDNLNYKYFVKEWLTSMPIISVLLWNCLKCRMLMLNMKMYLHFEA